MKWLMNTVLQQEEVEMGSAVSKQEKCRDTEVLICIMFTLHTHTQSLIRVGEKYHDI